MEYHVDFIGGICPGNVHLGNCPGELSRGGEDLILNLKDNVAFRITIIKNRICIEK